MSATVLAPVDERLGTLAATIEHAIRCGDALIEAKARVPRGEWEEWLLRTFPDRTPKTWRLYMRIAEHKDQVRTIGPASLHDAQRLLGGAGRRRHDEALKEQARQLRQEGRSYQAIADELEVSHHAVATWCNPVLAERRRVRSRQQSKAEQRRAHARSRAQTVAQVEDLGEYGGALADAHRKVALAAKSLTEALGLRDSGDSSRAAAQLAITKLNQAEDEIVRAARLTTNPEDAA